ncbi:MAG TPA: hypothetical protein VLW85_08395 [Myxococcales bacterium]|nr:hypothetical protein [Myxococcales bacterium]
MAHTKEKTAAAIRREQRARERGRAQELLGLFAWHRDGALVARALGVTLDELTGELEALKIRRKAFALTRGTDAQLPKAVPRSGPPGPPVRRRTPLPRPPPPEPAQPARNDDAAELKKVLAEVGPRRDALAGRLGLSGPALLARFRAAGLERELALRERDLIRALWMKHRAGEAAVAAELRMEPPRVREIARERGLSRELDGMRERFRREARAKKWPRERIEQVLRHRGELRELGLWDELLAEVGARISVIWRSLQGKPQALALLSKKLHLSSEEADKLRELLHLR